jgi:hypothetical protein
MPKIARSIWVQLPAGLFDNWYVYSERMVKKALPWYQPALA